MWKILISLIKSYLFYKHAAIELNHDTKTTAVKTQQRPTQVSALAFAFA
jgi:hypothetical protein